MVQRDNSYDLLRLFGSLLVLYGHSFVLAGSAYVPGFLGSSVHTVGVKIFFVVSGYLITQSWLRDPHIGRYFQRRLLRILPAFVVCVFLTVFVMGPLVTSRSFAEYFSDPATYRYLSNAGFYINYYLPGFFEGNVSAAVNGSLWTLPVEMAAYIACPIVLFIPNRIVVRIAVCLALVGSIYYDQAGRSVPPQDHIVFYATSLYYANQLLVYFWIGCFVSIFSLDKFINLQGALLLFFVVLAIPPYFKIQLYLPYLVIPYLTLALGNAKLSPAFTWVKKGDISYGLYLWAYPVQQIVVSSGITNNNPIMVFLVSTFFTAILATGSWFLIERPALALKPKSRVRETSDADSSQSATSSQP
jgi:peptidoglycan/LPS O-acetylase OafA/YrhL